MRDNLNVASFEKGIRMEVEQGLWHTGDGERFQTKKKRKKKGGLPYFVSERNGRMLLVFVFWSRRNTDVPEKWSKSCKQRPGRPS